MLSKSRIEDLIPHLRGVWTDIDPVYSWIQISTYSPHRRDMWVREFATDKMEYEIVLLPGYRRPPRLHTHDIDSIWYHGPIEGPTPVWDGMYPARLFETILECFDPYLEMKPFIKVRHRKTGRYIEWPFSDEFLKNRPKRDFHERLRWSQFYLKGRLEHFKEVYGYYTAASRANGTYKFVRPEDFDPAYRDEGKLPRELLDLWKFAHGIENPDDDSRGDFIGDLLQEEDSEAVVRRAFRAKGAARVRDRNMRFGLALWEKQGREYFNEYERIAQEELRAKMKRWEEMDRARAEKNKKKGFFSLFGLRR